MSYKTPGAQCKVLSLVPQNTAWRGEKNRGSSAYKIFHAVEKSGSRTRDSSSFKLAMRMPCNLQKESVCGSTMSKQSRHARRSRCLANGDCSRQSIINQMSRGNHCERLESFITESSTTKMDPRDKSAGTSMVRKQQNIYFFEHIYQNHNSFSDARSVLLCPSQLSHACCPSRSKSYPHNLSCNAYCKWGSFLRDITCRTTDRGSKNVHQPCVLLCR